MQTFVINNDLQCSEKRGCLLICPTECPGPFGRQCLTAAAGNQPTAASNLPEKRFVRPGTWHALLPRCRPTLKGEAVGTQSNDTYCIELCSLSRGHFRLSLAKQLCILKPGTQHCLSASLQHELKAVRTQLATVSTTDKHIEDYDKVR